MLIHSAIALPGYQMTALLYAGSRTLVYRAIRAADQQSVVIKLLKHEHPSFGELVQFRNQYTIAKGLELPGIIQPYSLEPYHNGYALVMEDGGVSLAQFMQEAGGRMSFADFLAIALQLCDILHDLYQQRVIHKDIKPANILINAEQQVKLIDFSIASLLPKETPEIQSPNVLEGTLAYLSPEQTGRMNRGIDYRSDFYSLGVTFYELLTGQRPFLVADPLELIHCHLAKQPPSIDSLNIASLNTDSLNPELPPVLSDIVSKLMAKNAEDRYQSIFGLKHDLERCAEQWQQGTMARFELGQRDVCDRFLIPETLYGRESEVQLLLDAFERVAGGGRVDESMSGSPPSPRSELMLIAGFSGIGKTAVVNEVHKPIARQRGYFIKGKFDQFQRNIPLSAFVQAFRDLMGQLLSESDGQLEQWKTKILAALGENAQVIIEVIPELERIIGLQSPAPALSGSAAQARFDRLLQQFVQVFTTPDHPLVIFIDDLQWADAASLNLMRSLMGEANTRYLLFLGAYRDNEVTVAHPLMLSLDEMQGAVVQTMTLAPLTQASVNQLVADTLSCSLTLALPLTVLIMAKTGGNPFFTTQFLKALYDDRLITFNGNEHYWECDITQVRSLTLTDDVVEFMATQLQKLPTSTQTVLKLAACIGNQFDLSTLAIVSEQPETEVAATLWKALQEGLVMPQSDVYKFYQDAALTAHQSPFSSSLTTHQCSYRFLHDRVQQAAYSLIPDEQKQATHLQIGRLLLQNTPTEDIEAHIFEIVGHWNQALDAISAAAETEELTRLNLLAGRKAKASAAYAAALSYLQVGLRLLTQNTWRTHYQLTLQLHEAAADAAYLSGEFEVADQLIETVFAHARSYTDQIKSYEVRLQSYMAQAHLADALYTGLAILKISGIALPEAPTPEEIQHALESVATALGDKTLSDLAQLPPMQDALCLAAMRILVNIIAATYQFAPALFPLIVCQMMQLTIAHGNSPEAAFTFACYGMMLLQQDLGAAHDYGQLACQLDTVPQTGDRVQATFVAGSILFHCKLHVRAALPFLLRAYQAGLDTGNFQFGGYALMNRAQYLYFVGQELTQVRQEMVVVSQALTATKQGNTLPWAQSFAQAVLNLLEQSDDPCRLQGTAYDETRSLPQQLAANDRTGLHYVYLNKLILSYLFGQYQSAADHAAHAEVYLDGVLGFLDGYVFCFYDSLIQLALHHTAAETLQATLLAKVQANQAQMQVWASHAPMNFQHKYDLVEAERYRVLGQKAAAIDLYDHAIAGAKANQYIQEAAIANELAAKFYLEWGKERIAQDYLINAYYGYAHWGAKAKVVDLEQRYPTLLAAVLQQDSLPRTIAATSSAAAVGASNTVSNLSAALDLETILKAFQSISGEMQLETLLSTLLAIVLENAGADTCTLLLLKADQLLIEATAAIGQPSVVLQALPLEAAQTVPIALINTVKRTLQPAIIANAAQAGGLMADPYILRQQPKSVLCTPILHQGKLLGLLYLENNLTTGAFTGDRVKLLNLLCAQAAISLENARLYQQSQQALADLNASKAQLQRMTDNIPGIVYHFKVAPDGSASTPYMSPGCIDLFEVTPEAFMTGAKDFREMEHPDDRLAIARAVAQATQTLVPLVHESRIITTSGRVKWIQTICRPERQADGSVLWDGLKIDITDRIQAERQVKESQQFLQLLLDNIPQLVFWKNRDSVFQGCNAVAVKRWGLESSAALVGKTDYDFSFTSEEAAWYQECDRRVMDSGQAELHIMETQQQADGSQSWLDTCKIPLRDSDGQVIGILVAVEDITEARRAEDIRIQAEAALQEQEQFLRSIYDGAEIVIFVVDVLEDGNLAYAGWNAAAERVVGRSSTAIIGKTLTEVWGEQQGEVLRQQFARCISTGTALCFEECLTFDGQETWWFANLNPLKNAAGQIHRLIGTTFDISDRKRAETQLNQRTLELEQTLQALQRTQTQMVQSEKMSGLGQLVAGVAHEINNPVNFIYGNLSHATGYTQDLIGLLQLYEQHYPTPHPDIQHRIIAIDLEFLTEDLRKLLTSMKVGADRIQRIVASLRNFSRMDEADMKAVNIHEGIDSTLMILQHRLKAKANVPTINVIKAYGALPLVECYAGQLNQVFMNLLSNAIDALDEALEQGQGMAPTPTITIHTALLEHQQVAIQITDNGAGIPDRVKQRLFDPFFTTKQVGKGTGMGLSISYQIVAEKHKGTLQCVSTSGQGTTFTVTIPMRQS